MFLHRVKMNWKRYQKLTMAILLFALAVHLQGGTAQILPRLLG